MSKFLVLGAVAVIALVAIIAVSTTNSQFQQEQFIPFEAEQWWGQAQQQAAQEPVQEVEPTEQELYYQEQQQKVADQWSQGQWGVGQVAVDWQKPDIVSKFTFVYDFSQATETKQIHQLKNKVFQNDFYYQRSANYSFQHRAKYQDMWKLNNTNAIGYIQIAPTTKLSIKKADVTEAGTLMPASETVSTFKFNTPRKYFKDFQYSTDVTVPRFSCSKATINVNYREFQIPFTLAIHLQGHTQVRNVTGVYFLRTASDLDVKRSVVPCNGEKKAATPEQAMVKKWGNFRGGQ